MKRLADVEERIERESTKRHEITPDTEVKSAPPSRVIRKKQIFIGHIQSLAQEMFQTLAKNDAKEFFEVKGLTDRPTDSSRPC